MKSHILEVTQAHEQPDLQGPWFGFSQFNWLQKEASFEGTPKAAQTCSRHKVQLVGRVTLPAGPKSLDLHWRQDADRAAGAQHSPEIHNALTVMVASCVPGHYGL